MALLSLGRNVVMAEELGPLTDEEVAAPGATDMANKKLEDARKSLLAALTPWIPGDFVITYGLLLTAWTAMRGSFFWMIAVSTVCAIAFVVLGAFSETGFKKAKDRSSQVRNRLVSRTVVGFLVSIYASIAVPNSGWHDFGWFVRNELPIVLTAGALLILAIPVLKGFQKRWGYSLGVE